MTASKPVAEVSLTMVRTSATTINTFEFEQFPFVKPTGFREYDARWLFGTEINLAGIQQIGLGLGTLVHARGLRPAFVVGHDYRSYSASIKYALISGLLASGCEVHDIGLCTTPMAYFAQFDLDVPCVAMVTASHNENGWTGIKMGIERPLTFGPDDMTELKHIVLDGKTVMRDGGRLVLEPSVFAAYQNGLLQPGKISRKLRVAAVCGNGTAGKFAPDVLRAAGCDVVEVDCALDYNFPNYNPNPEDMKMLNVMAKAVADHKLDVAFGFDGDGDRCGVIDNKGQVIFSDKVGLMLARDMSAVKPGSKFVVDVKSTGLYGADPVLKANGATVDIWKTGHSYIKRRTKELGAVAGFEKSGHFFFQPPFGLGYDDGISSALAICRMLDRAAGKSLADLYASLPQSFSSPTMSPHCDDEKKYQVVEAITTTIQDMANTGNLVCGQKITSVNTVNGVRFILADDSWGLIRASSNKPELVVVCESMTSARGMKDVFNFIRSLLAVHPVVGAFNQEI
jgi:phosphomannomutase / phosphoglucomutase